MVEYKKGHENKVIDALSRREELGDVTLLNEGSLFLISFPFPSWIEELKLSYQLLPKVQKCSKICRVVPLVLSIFHIIRN